MERIIVRAPTEGLDARVDPSNLQSRFAADVQNMRIEGADILAKRSGFVNVGTNLPLQGSVMHIDQFYKLNGSMWSIVITTTNVYYYNDVDHTWVDISPVGGLHGTLSDPVSADIVLDTYIFSNGVDPIMCWSGTGVVEPLTGAPAGKVVKKFAERLFVLGLSNNPQALAWTAPGSITDWSGPGSGTVSLYEGVDWIVTAELLGPFLMIYKERSIVACQYVGGSTLFRFDVAEAGVGCFAPKALVNMGNEHIFLGSDNVYAYGGGRGLEIIGDPVQPQIFGMLNPLVMQRCCSLINEDLNELWIVIPTASSEIPNVAWVYNYMYKKWLKHAVAMTCAGFWNVEAMPTLGSITGTIGESQIRLGERMYLEAAPLVVIGTADGYVRAYDPTLLVDGAASIDGFFVTKLFNGSEAESAKLPPDVAQRIKRWLGVEFVAKGQKVKVECSLDGIGWITLGDVTLDSEWRTYRLDFDKSGRCLQLRFSNNEARSGFYLREYTIKFKVGADR